MCETHDKQLASCGFIKTKTLPHIYYLPKKHNDTTLALLSSTTIATTTSAASASSAPSSNPTSVPMLRDHNQETTSDVDPAPVASSHKEEDKEEVVETKDGVKAMEQEGETATTITAPEKKQTEKKLDEEVNVEGKGGVKAMDQDAEESAAPLKKKGEKLDNENKGEMMEVEETAKPMD